MAGKSPLQATELERSALEALACSGGRAEADRARAVLLTLAGWTSNRISQAFGVRKDTVRLRCPAGDCGLVTLRFRSPNSFMRPSVQMPRGFCRLATSAAAVDYKTH
jgi:hypothetical protein